MFIEALSKTWENRTYGVKHGQIDKFPGSIGTAMPLANIN
jgi:hypothetical protein